MLGTTGNDLPLDAEIAGKREDRAFARYETVGAAFDDEAIVVIGRHQASETARPLQEGHPRPGRGETPRSDHSRDASPDHHHVGPHRHLL